MSEKNKEVHLQLSVFRSRGMYQVVSLSSFEGIDEPYIFAFGFTKDGIPVLNQNEDSYYKFSGGVCACVNLNFPFHVGLDIKGYEKKFIGYDALQVMISNYGLHISIKEMEEKVKILIQNDAKSIFFYKLSSQRAMAKAYGFEDSWIISGKQAEINLDYWNSFLKSINSEWRLNTMKTKTLLRKLEYKRLMTGEV